MADHEANCPALQAWDIPGACTCGAGLGDVDKPVTVEDVVPGAKFEMAIGEPRHVIVIENVSLEGYVASRVVGSEGRGPSWHTRLSDFLLLAKRRLTDE